MQLLHVSFSLNSLVRWCHSHINVMKEETEEAFEKLCCWPEVTQLVNDSVRPWPKSVSGFYGMTSSGNYWGDTASVGQTPWINRTRMLYKGIQIVVIFERSYLKAKGGLKGSFKFPLSLLLCNSMQSCVTCYLEYRECAFNRDYSAGKTHVSTRVWFWHPF